VSEFEPFIPSIRIVDDAVRAKTEEEREWSKVSRSRPISASLMGSEVDPAQRRRDSV